VALRQAEIEILFQVSSHSLNVKLAKPLYFLAAITDCLDRSYQAYFVGSEYTRKSFLDYFDVALFHFVYGWIHGSYCWFMVGSHCEQVD
jgi:hypothetical protein